MSRPPKAEADRLTRVGFRLLPGFITRLEQLGAQRGTDRSEALRTLLALGDAAYRRGERPAPDRPAPRAGDTPC